MRSIHRFTVEGIFGEPIDLARFRGRKMIIVNVASECGYTGQYGPLQELYEQYKDKLIVIGCPSNDFGGQEPGNATEIAHFCERNYGVTFPLTKKISIKPPDVHPVYQWLTDGERNGVRTTEVNWNFCKYLLDDTGRWVEMYPSAVHPLDERILAWLDT